MNGQPYGVLYVDDETISLKYFEKGFSKSFKTFTTASAAEGWDLLEKQHDEIGVLMTDQRMPGESGVELLEKVRARYPQIIRILVTAHSDIQSAIDAVNDGAIYKYISKPWDVDDLRITLLRALEYFVVLKERDELLREKLSVLQQIVLADRAKNLGVFAAGLSSRFRRTVEAAAQFMADVPQGPLEQAGDLPGRRMIFRSVDQSIREASGQIYRLAIDLEQFARQSSLPETATVQEVVDRLGSEEVRSKTGSVAIEMEKGISGERLFGAPGAVAICEKLAGSVRSVAAPNDCVAIRVGKTEMGAAGPAVEFSISDGNLEWTAEQRRQFFAPFCGVQPGSGRAGLDLAACYFLAHHFDGRISTPGSEQAKAKFLLPQSSAGGSAGVIQEKELEQLFRYETTWEEFFQRKL